MNACFKEPLRVCRVYLVQNVEYDNLGDLILQYKILPEGIVETIDSLSNRREKVRKMLESLSRRPDYAFVSFLAALCHSEQSHIARVLYQTTMNMFTDDGHEDKKWFEKCTEQLGFKLEANKQISIGGGGKEFPIEEKSSEQAVLGQLQMKGTSSDNQPVENSISMSFEKLWSRRSSCIERMESEETAYFDLQGCPSSSNNTGNNLRPSSWTIQTQQSPFISSPSSQSHENPPGSNPITATNNTEPVSAYPMDGL